MDIMDKFFGGLKETMDKALNPEGPAPEKPEEVTLETLGKSLASIGERLDVLEKPAEKPEEEPEEKGDGEGALDVEALTKGITEAVTGVVAPIKEAVEAHGEVLEKVMDRVEQLEGRTAVRKSATGDEVEEEKGDKPEPKEALFKSVQTAIRTSKKVTLT
ncbi:hypothetical protein LCGC14_0662840 [marine sediment metagenome]|uniref:Uncharacterized protein n=1 Tax=marine sediment metagenome TaxID=412755 RepID=A0A0F9QY64_9ZZZZ